MRATNDNIVNSFETGFLECDGFNIVVFFKHGDYVVETDIPLEPIWIPDTWLNASQWQIASLSYPSKIHCEYFPIFEDRVPKVSVSVTSSD